MREQSLRLTQAGLDLYPVLVSLLRWGDRYLDQPSGGPSVELTHRDCGEPVDVALRCRAGHEVASARDVRPRPGPGAVLLADDDPRAPARAAHPGPAAVPSGPAPSDSAGLRSRGARLPSTPAAGPSGPGAPKAMPSDTAASAAR